MPKVLLERELYITNSRVQTNGRVELDLGEMWDVWTKITMGDTEVKAFLSFPVQEIDDAVTFYATKRCKIILEEID